MSASRARSSLVAALAAALFAGCAAEGVEEADELVSDSEAAQTAGWATLGTGVTYKKIGEGDAVFVAYGGWSAKDPWVRAWAEELVRAKLGAMGVGHVYAVRGPADPGYRGREIGNRALGAHLAAGAGPDAPFVVVAAHSSGSYVAHELFDQLRDGSLDASGALRKKIVYANLDGGGGGLDRDLVRSLRRAAFVYAVDPALASGRSANAGTAESLASTYGSQPVRLSVRASGCRSGAKWCLHDLLITTRPHDPDRFDLARDYTQFAGRPVQTGWIDAVATELR